MGDWLSSIDWNSILNYGLKILGYAIGTIVITYGTILFNKLKAKLGEAKLNSYIDRCVRAAEQLFPNLGNKTGKEKFDYVFNLVKDRYPKLPNEQIKMLIEGAVYSVSEQVKQIAAEKDEIASVTSLKVE